MAMVILIQQCRYWCATILHIPFFTSNRLYNVFILCMRWYSDIYFTSYILVHRYKYCIRYIELHIIYGSSWYISWSTLIILPYHVVQNSRINHAHNQEIECNRSFNPLYESWVLGDVNKRTQKCVCRGIRCIESLGVNQ